MKVAEIKALVVVGVFIGANNVLAEVPGIGKVERLIAASGEVGNRPDPDPFPTPAAAASA